MIKLAISLEFETEEQHDTLIEAFTNMIYMLDGQPIAKLTMKSGKEFKFDAEKDYSETLQLIPRVLRQHTFLPEIEPTPMEDALRRVK